MKEKIISLLRTNARLTAQEIAEILSVETAEVVSAVNEMENAGVIRGYTAIVTDDAPGRWSQSPG